MTAETIFQVIVPKWAAEDSGFDNDSYIAWNEAILNVASFEGDALQMQ